MNTVLDRYRDRPVIIGGGIAGMMAALTLAPRPVVVLAPWPLGAQTSSCLAQGGIAAAVAADDSTSLHVEDTLAAGDGLCDTRTVDEIIKAAPSVIERLERLGVVFDRDRGGSYTLGLEAAHSRHRVLHAGGDASGAGITSALANAVRSTPSITILEGVYASQLLTTCQGISGVVFIRGHETAVIMTSQVLMATGGLGSLYEATTNPIGSFGHGISLAAHAGAVLSDMEFVQFHPTALGFPRRPLSLVSEAVRGAGAVLLNANGRRLMDNVRDKDLAPRDVVARTVDAEIRRGGSVYLDARSALGMNFPQRFPTVDSLCRDAGVDPSSQLIPVVPAAHYHMGGIDVDQNGRSSLDGLWAAGEVASTGLHGANRLASNSLLEAAFTGIRAAEHMNKMATSSRLTRSRVTTDVTPVGYDVDVRDVRSIVSNRLGVIRSELGLRKAIADLLPMIELGDRSLHPATAALLMAVFALLRTETRGSHARSDFPERWTTVRRQKMTLAAAVAAARSQISDAHLRSA